MASTKNTARAHALGAALSEARTGKMTQRELAARLGLTTHTKIVNWERGKVAPSYADTAAVLGILGVTGDERDQILRLAHDAADPNWTAVGVHQHLAALSEYERLAISITNVQPLVIPGLLQTEDYARSIMLSAGATSGEADQRVKYRLGRREILTRDEPVEFHAIIGESALRFPPCARAVMASQLRHLNRWAKLPNVTVQALPLAQPYTPALEGPFVLLEFKKARPVVSLEHYRSATTLTDIGDVRDYETAAKRLRRDAMSPADTTGLIVEIAEEMEHTT